MTLVVEDEKKAHVHLGTAKAAPLAELTIRGDRLTGHLHGKLRTVPKFEAPMRIAFRLRRDGDRATGVATAMAPDYFALSHWVDLTRQRQASPE